MAEKRRQKPKTKLTDKAQSERFKETARSLGIVENKEFAQIFAKIARPKGINRQRSSG